MTERIEPEPGDILDDHFGALSFEAEPIEPVDLNLSDDHDDSAPDNVETESEEPYVDYGDGSGYTQAPPAVDYYAGQGYAVRYGNNGKPPSSDLGNIQIAPWAINVTPPPSAKPSPQKMRAVAAAFFTGMTITSAIVAVHNDHRTTNETTTAAPDPGMVDEKTTSIGAYFFDDLEARLNVHREYFGEKPVLSNVDTSDCLSHTLYGGPQPGDSGDIDVSVYGRYVLYRRGMVDKQITVTVHPNKGHEDQPDLVFKRARTFPYDTYKPANPQTQKIADENNCDR